MANKTLTVTTNTNGAVKAVSSNTNVATVSVSNKTVTIAPTGGGDCVVTISVTDDPNYITPAPVTCKVTVKTKAMYNGLDIQEIVRAGKAASMLAVGDRWPVKMKGRVGILDIDDTYYVCLIGIDHNKSVETAGRYNAHFKFPYGADGKQLAFCDSEYNVQGSGPGFRMNPGTTSSNVGGWKKSYALNTLSPQFLNILEESWKNAISDCVKYTDNVGNATGSVAANVTPTTQKIFYLSQWEIFAYDRYPYSDDTKNSINTYEKGYQQQYVYYANGNSTVHYRHNQPTVAVYVWGRSPWVATAIDFFLNNELGCPNWSGMSRFSEGTSPGFSIS